MDLQRKHCYKFLLCLLNYITTLKGKPFTLESSLAFLDVTFHFKIVFTKKSHCNYFL